MSGKKLMRVPILLSVCTHELQLLTGVFSKQINKHQSKALASIMEIFI